MAHDTNYTNKVNNYVYFFCKGLKRSGSGIYMK